MVLLRDLWPDAPSSARDLALSGLVSDSRRVLPGCGFVALTGFSQDARHHVPDAIRAGAVVVLVQAGGDWQADRVIDGVPVFVIPDLDQQLGEMASRLHGVPSASFDVAAVTGTNGKTSIANLIAGASTALGQRAAVIGTLGNGFYGALQPSAFTTPDPLQLQGLLAGFRDQGARLVAMEASSHGLQQGRMKGTRVRVALFTNLTRDHLDYHGDMASYAAAKALLFRWPDLQAAVINLDDPQGAVYRGLLADGVRCLTYSLDPASPADLVAREITLSLDGLVIKVGTPQGDVTLRSPLLGRFNASNLLAVLGGLLQLGHDLQATVAALATVQPVAGRMQCLRRPGTPLAVVDYAHTPDALEQALRAAREHATGRLWCVFGCGGGRDTGKRPEMGRLAAQLADHCVITTDNPREEDPLAILAHVRSGMPADAAVTVIADRAQAIRHALDLAAPDDLVLVAGKGHETYQEVMGVRHPFNDVEQISQALAARSPA